MSISEYDLAKFIKLSLHPWLRVAINSIVVSLNVILKLNIVIIDNPTIKLVPVLRTFILIDILILCYNIYIIFYKKDNI